MAVSTDAARRRAVFLDKDGTLIENVPYNVDAARIRFAPGAEHALPLLAAAGFVIAVVSNQAGVARGLFDEAAVAAVGDRLTAMLAALGVRLAGFYYCPHDPDGRIERYRRSCMCRKPAPELLEQAARELGVDLESSWVIGDILDDVEAGRRAGCRTVLIDAGSETEWRMSRQRLPHHAVAGLAEAADLILALDDDVARDGARIRAPSSPSRAEGAASSERRAGTASSGVARTTSSKRGAVGAQGA